MGKEGEVNHLEVRSRSYKYLSENLRNIVLCETGLNTRLNIVSGR